MPSSGNLITKNKQLSEELCRNIGAFCGLGGVMGSHEMYIDKLNEDITRLTAELAEWQKPMRLRATTEGGLITDIYLADEDGDGIDIVLDAQCIMDKFNEGRRELAEAKKDTARLDWLDHYPAIIRYAAIVGSKVRPIIDRHMYECMSDAERAAIEDAATPEANTGCSPTSPPAIDEAKGE